MAKVIFVLQRRAGLTREQALAQWSGEQHVPIVGKRPGLTRYVQNHVDSAPAEPVCDGIGELWFATDGLMNEALNSPEMTAAVEDAKRFLDMERTGMILVQEKILIGLSAHTPTTRGYLRVMGIFDPAPPATPSTARAASRSGWPWPGSWFFGDDDAVGTGDVEGDAAGAAEGGLGEPVLGVGRGGDA